VVVAFSVIVQGGTVPAAARRLKIPLRTVETEPWSLSIGFRKNHQEEPERPQADPEGHRRSRNIATLVDTLRARTAGRPSR
jgi:hypothetical protein